jgi:hypothetical protein
MSCHIPWKDGVEGAKLLMERMEKHAEVEKLRGHIRALDGLITRWDRNAALGQDAPDHTRFTPVGGTTVRQEMIFLKDACKCYTGVDIAELLSDYAIDFFEEEKPVQDDSKGALSFSDSDSNYDSDSD